MYGHPGYGSPVPGYGDGLSPKSKVVAGLLQLFLGNFGAGRFYLGHIKIAVIQLVAYWVGVLIYLGGFLSMLAQMDAFDPATGAVAADAVPPFSPFALLGLLIMFGVGIWLLVDAIRMFLGNVPDAQGRPLR